MARVRAKVHVYLGDQGYHAEGEEFDYTGPENHNLEYLDKKDPDDSDKKYHQFSREELKAELDKRGIEYTPQAGEKTLRGLLETDDAK